MSYTQLQSGGKERQAITALYHLLGNFFSFLSQTPQPSDMEVRNQFISFNNLWLQVCNHFQLMNMSNLFTLNVRQRWHQKERNSIETK